VTRASHIWGDNKPGLVQTREGWTVLSSRCNAQGFAFEGGSMSERVDWLLT
jgi:hypothetical protein